MRLHTTRLGQKAVIGTSCTHMSNPQTTAKLPYSTRNSLAASHDKAGIYGQSPSCMRLNPWWTRVSVTTLMVSVVNPAHPASKPQSYHMHVRKTSNLYEKTARRLLIPQLSVAWPSENEVACPVPPAAAVPRRQEWT